MSEISEIETNKTKQTKQQQNNESKTWFSKKIKKIDRLFAQLTKRKNAPK